MAILTGSVDIIGWCEYRTCIGFSDFEAVGGEPASVWKARQASPIANLKSFGVGTEPAQIRLIAPGLF